MREPVYPVFARVRSFRGLDYLKINVLFFALAALSQSFHSIILPVRILDFVGESQKNTFLGIMTFTGLLIAMLYQPLAGALSDRAQTPWGRRRPFIAAGIAGLLLCLAGVGLAGSYAVLFLSYVLMQIAGNTAQGPYQALLPELAPAGQRGVASAVKNMLEVAGGVVMVGIASVLIGNYQRTHLAVWLWLALLAVAAVLVAALLLTLTWVRDPHPQVVVRASLKAAVRRTFHLDLERDKPFLWFLLSRALVFMALTTIQQFALYFFRDVMKVSNPAEATFVFLGVAVVVMVVAAYPAGKLGDRFPRQNVSAIAAWVGAAAVLLILVLPRQYLFMLIPAALLGAALVAFSATNWALAADLVMPGEEARYLGLANMATAGGGALARLIGPFIDFFNRQGANLGYDFMLAACIIYFVLGGLFALRVNQQSG